MDAGLQQVSQGMPAFPRVGSQGHRLGGGGATDPRLLASIAGAASVRELAERLAEALGLDPASDSVGLWWLEEGQAFELVRHPEPRARELPPEVVAGVAAARTAQRRHGVDLLPLVLDGATIGVVDMGSRGGDSPTLPSS